MANQFLHIDTFGLGRQNPKAGKTKKRRTTARWTIQEIIDELKRRDGACDHVAEPRPAVLIYGEDPDTVRAEIQRNAAAAKDPRGRKLRVDAQLLISGVASYPIPREDVVGPEMEIYEDWEKRTVGFLRGQFGANLRYCIRHEDESFLHLHFGVAGDLDPATGRYSIEDLHPGMAARARAREEAKAKGQEPKRGKLEAAMRDGLREFQDSYHHAVSRHFGHTRDGPKRKRLTRAEWKAQQAAARRDAVIAMEHEALGARVDQLTAAAKRRDVHAEEYQATVEMMTRLHEKLEAEQRARRKAEDDRRRQKQIAAQERARAEKAEAEVSRLQKITAQMKRWMSQATGIIGRLLGIGDTPISSKQPRWMPDNLWNALESIERERQLENAVGDVMAGLEIQNSGAMTRTRTRP